MGASTFELVDEVETEAEGLMAGAEITCESTRGRNAGRAESVALDR